MLNLLIFSYLREIKGLCSVELSMKKCFITSSTVLNINRKIKSKNDTHSKTRQAGNQDVSTLLKLIALG